MSEQWIVIPKWDEFQHYRDRTAPWIKNYADLLHNDAYLGLTTHQRGVLHGLWLVYASARCQVALDTASLSRQLNARVTRATLDSLNHAGFIGFVASKPLARRYHAASTSREEKRREEGVPPSAPVENAAVGTPRSELLARFDNWVKFEGYEYVDDQAAFVDELRRRHFIPGTDSPLAGELLERARSQYQQVSP